MLRPVEPATTNWREKVRSSVPASCAAATAPAGQHDSGDNRAGSFLIVRW